MYTGMDKNRKHMRSILPCVCLTALMLMLAVALPTSAIEWTSLEWSVRGFPVLRDLGGRRRAEEEVVLRQRPQLAQESWSFREWQGGKPTRAFTVDLRTGAASAVKEEKGETKHWSETLDVVEGQTFAGFGFSLAIKALRERMVKGETITLKGIGFAPKPRLAAVELSYGGRDRIRMAGRTIAADRFIVHPKIPAIAKLFIKVPDAQIWMTTPPAGFLRWEGAMAEPDDQIIRVDLLPGGTSEAAVPVATSGTRK